MPTINGNGWGSRYVKSDCTWNIWWCMGVEDEISSLFAFSKQGMISHEYGVLVELQAVQPNKCEGFWCFVPSHDGTPS